MAVTVSPATNQVPSPPLNVVNNTGVQLEVGSVVALAGWSSASACHCDACSSEPACRGGDRHVPGVPCRSWLAGGTSRRREVAPRRVASDIVGRTRYGNHLWSRVSVRDHRLTATCWRSSSLPRTRSRVTVLFALFPHANVDQAVFHDCLRAKIAESDAHGPLS